MSNKIVPAVYRSIIDDVISSVRPDFDSHGVDEEVLNLLADKWQQLLLQTNVADFDSVPQQPHASTSSSTLSQHHLVGGGPGVGGNVGNGSFLPMLQPTPVGTMNPGQMNLPPRQVQQQQGQWNNGLKGGDEALRLRGGGAETDEDDYGDSDSDPATPPLHPSHLPVLQPTATTSSSNTTNASGNKVKPEPNAQGLLPGDDEIGSDLDDSSDEELGGDGEEDDGGVEGGDIVFCVYDKVQRVKNKWKLVFKDGMAHINGKDYLFAKCTSDLEW